MVRRDGAFPGPRLNAGRVGSVAHGLFHEAGALDDHAGDPTRGDQPVAVAHRHAEVEAAALDRLERGLGAHVATDRGRREVVELHAVPDAGGAFAELALDRTHRRFFGQGHHPRGGEHRDIARPQRERGVVVGDDELDGGGQAGA